MDSFQIRRISRIMCCATGKQLLHPGIHLFCKLLTSSQCSFWTCCLWSCLQRETNEANIMWSSVYMCIYFYLEFIFYHFSQGIQTVLSSKLFNYAYLILFLSLVAMFFHFPFSGLQVLFQYSRQRVDLCLFYFIKACDKTVFWNYL